MRQEKDPHRAPSRGESEAVNGEWLPSTLHFQYLFRLSWPILKIPSLLWVSVSLR